MDSLSWDASPYIYNRSVKLKPFLIAHDAAKFLLVCMAFRCEKSHFQNDTFQTRSRARVEFSVPSQ